MQMEIMELGLYRTNCYIVWDGKEIGRAHV